MNILIVRNYPSYMSVTKSTYNIQEVGLAKALVKRGHCCDVLLWTNREECEVTIPVCKDHNLKVYYRFGKAVLKNTWYPCLGEMIENYDIIQLSEYDQYQSWYYTKKYPKKALVYHGPYYSGFNKRYNLYTKIFDFFKLKDYLKSETQFITKSNLARQQLLNKGIKSRNVTAIGVGIDIEMLSSKVENFDIDFINRLRNDSENIRLLYIGKIEPRRNIKFIFDIVSRVNKIVGNYRLHYQNCKFIMLYF